MVSLLLVVRLAEAEGVLVRGAGLGPGAGGQAREDRGRGEGEEEHHHHHHRHSQLVTESWAVQCGLTGDWSDWTLLTWHFNIVCHLQPPSVGTISINSPNPPSLLEWQYGGIIRLVTWHFALCCFQIEKMFKNSLEEDYRDFCQNSVKEIFVDKEFFVGRLSNISWLQIDLHAKSDICEALLERATIIY